MTSGPALADIKAGCTYHGTGNKPPRRVRRRRVCRVGRQLPGCHEYRPAVGGIVSTPQIQVYLNYLTGDGRYDTAIAVADHNRHRQR